MRKALLDVLLVYGWPGRLPQPLNRRRAEEIVARVKAFATLFAVLTVAWTAVDALVFEGVRLAGLAVARIVAGAFFAILALSCRLPAPTLKQARSRLALLLLIPGAFFLVSQAILPGAPAAGLPQGVAAAYAFVPFVLAAGIGAFPLALAEAVSLAAFTFAVEAAASWVGGQASVFARPEDFWLLFLIGGAAAFAASSQLTLMAALIEQAIRDPLTRCLRHESGAEVLETQFLLARRQRAALAVLFVDIDHFKAVNDEFGHETGDHVLAAAAEALRAMARESDVLIRWGGEEFVVVLPNTSRTEAVTLIQRLRARGLGTQPDGRAVTVSIGIAECQGDATASAADLVSLADQRMYAAKQAGRNRYVLDSSGEAYPVLAPAAAPESSRAASETSTASR